MIYAKFSKDLFNISKVIGRKRKWPRFFGLPGSRLGYRLARVTDGELYSYIRIVSQPVKSNRIIPLAHNIQTNMTIHEL